MWKAKTDFLWYKAGDEIKEEVTDEWINNHLVEEIKEVVKAPKKSSKKKYSFRKK